MSAPPTSEGNPSEEGERIAQASDMQIPIAVEAESVPDTMPQTGDIRTLLLDVRRLVATTSNDIATQIHRFETKLVDMVMETNVRVSRLEGRVETLEQGRQGWQ